MPAAVLRIDASIRYLRDLGCQRIARIAHSRGAPLSSLHRPAQRRGHRCLRRDWHECDGLPAADNAALSLAAFAGTDADYLYHHRLSCRTRLAGEPGAGMGAMNPHSRHNQMAGATHCLNDLVQ